MKTLTKIAVLPLMLFSLSAVADTITITGDPVILEQQGEVWVTPDTFTPGTSYNYVIINGMNRVCFNSPQSNLSTLDMMAVPVNINGTTSTWNCYAVSPDFFTITP